MIKRIQEKISNISLSTLEKLIIYVISPKKVIEHSVTFAKDWCFKNEIRTLGDINEKLLKMLSDGSITDDEILQLVESDLKKFETKSEHIMKEMKKQHFLTWKLILTDRIYILIDDIDNDIPKLWNKRCGSCCGDIIDDCNEYYIRRNNLISLDLIVNEICENEQNESEFYFCLIELKYPELLKAVRKYIPIINKSVALKDYRMSTILKQIKKKIDFRYKH
jgi:hypothetical protein